jgi:rRNA-processing protein FCF1
VDAPIILPLAVITELRGLVLNERTELQAQDALDWIDSKPANVQLVSHTGSKVSRYMRETWEGRVDDLILNLSVGCILVTDDVNMRMLARTRGIRIGKL